MTSLYPGLLFYSVGLNKKSTPVKPETSPSEIDRKLGRAPFNGRPWPKPSPVSSVYDVRNSSTRMIILNNKLSRKPKGSRLRGQTDHEGEIVLPEPERHATDSKPQTNWEHHTQCSLSVSKKFVPIFPPTVTPTPAWVNQTQRPAMKFDNGSGVNPNHHIQCQGHMDYDIVRWYNAHAHRRVGGAHGSRPTSRADGASASRALSPILNNPALTRGERRYLSSIAKIYSVDNMRQQKQVQYNKLMWKEISKGSYKDGEWEKYQRYLNTPRKTQFGPCDPFREKRSVSVPGLNRGGRDENRPYTSQTANRSVAGSSRSTSTAPAKASRNYRPSTRGRGQKASTGKQGGASASGPARVESPLPPLDHGKQSASSLSSLGEEEAGNAEARKGEGTKDQKSHEETSPQFPQQNESNNQVEQHTDKEELSLRATTTIAVEEEEEKRKGSDEDEDERSKMSARDPAVSDEQRGSHVAYRPTYGEREGETERVGDGQGQSSHHPSQGQETYTQNIGHSSEGQESALKGKTESKDGDATRQAITSSGRAVAQSAEHENARPESPMSVPATSTASEKDDVEEVVRLAKTPESVATVYASKGDEANTTNSHERLNLHKEGKDRPLSRLGGREQFMVVKKDRENSDDDYSDDDGDDDGADKREPPIDTPQADNSQPTAADVRSRGGAARMTSNMTSSEDADVKGSSNGQGHGVNQEKTPTAASTQEKPSDISTIEY